MRTEGVQPRIDRCPKGGPWSPFGLNFRVGRAEVIASDVPKDICMVIEVE